MRVLIATLALALALPALAQEAGDSMYAAQDTASRRFLDDETAGPDLDAGDKVTVLFVEGDQVRIRRGDRYGWVAASALTSESPTPATAPASPAAPAAGDFDMEALRQLLERTKTE